MQIGSKILNVRDSKDINEKHTAELIITFDKISSDHDSEAFILSIVVKVNINYEL